MTEPAPAIQPAPMDSRYLSLDALRGFAVMGILAMNIVAFAMPMMAYISPAVYGGTEPADIGVWLFSFLVFDGKMRGLFSLLFGASMMLVIEHAEAKGENAIGVHYSRMVWLALFGIAHFLLIWFGDILFLYAAIGCVAFLFRHWDVDRLIKWALIIYIAGFVLWTTLFAGFLMLQAAAAAPDASPETLRAYRDAIGDLHVSPADIAREIAVYTGDWPGIVAFKWSQYAAQPISQIIQNAPETLPLMMLGMALLKNGFLTGELEASSYRQTARWMLPVGFGLTALIAAVVIAKDFDLLWALNATIGWTYPPRLMLTLGYAALLVLAIKRFAASGFIARVAAAGRTAFTNYLGTSILMTTIFYGYGLGLYGEVGRIELYLFVLGAWALMLVWSKPWLDRFRYGPLEWLWRSLARRKLQPIRKVRAVTF